MLIYEALISDHNELKPLLDQLVAASQVNARTKDLLDQVQKLLIPHSRAEEAVFYNALRSIDSVKDIVNHSYTEHMEAEALLRALKGLGAIGIEWTTATKKLRESLLHHIADEEGRVFTQARQVLLDEEARQMAQAFAQAKRRAQQQGDLKNLGDLVANLMPPRFKQTQTPAGLPR